MRVRSDAGPYAMASGSYRIDYDDQRPPALNQEPWTARYRSYSREMVDDPHLKWIKDSNGRSVMAFKNVSHTQWSGTFSGSTMSYHYSGSPGGLVSGLDTRFFCPVLDSDGYRDPSLMALKTVGDLIATAIGTTTIYTGHYNRWEAIKPSMTTRANLAVFLAELRDIKRMFDLLPKKHFSLGDWRTTFRYANGLHLNYNFGWKPFLRDLVNFTKAYRSFDERLKKFMKNELRPIRRSKRDTPTESTTTWTAGSSGPWVLDYQSTLKVTRGSTFMFSYSIPQFDWSELQWRAWADSLGLHLSPKNVWAILPWSFVVDWFVDVSGYLSQYDSDWIEPWIEFLQACSSELTEVELNCNVRGPAAWGSPSGNLYHIQYRKFARATGVPQFQWDSQSLNADRIRLLASLVASRVV